ncbi:MAG: prolyl oligopeptidase family serine peptidase [Lentisphaeria bacterium]|jgi:cephalosporin-C deacetylase-like acetyl esterase
MAKLNQDDFVMACVAGIEVAVFGAADLPSTAPIVFVTHGRGGMGLDCHGWCRELAAMGCIAIALDQRNHGRRLVDGRVNGNWSPTHAADMYGVFLGTAMDVGTLIDMIPARLGLTSERIGMTGGSLGGHATLLAMAVDPRIRVGVPLIGSGDYRRLMELRAAANNCPAADFDQYFPPELAAVVNRRDPIHCAAVFADRPLLMLNGADDNLVQLACNQRFEAAARAHYKDGSRLKLVAYPGVGHEMTPEMWSEAKAWFKTWL